MKKRIIPAILLLALAATACTQELSESITTVRTFDTFSATIAEEPVTRLAMGASGVLQWEVGDVISIFSDTEPSPVEFSMQEDGRFHGSPVSGSKFTAFYKAGKGEGSLLNVGSLDAFSSESNKYLPMFAVSNDANLQFKQTCGLIHIHITGSRSWDTVMLKGNGMEPVIGDGTIDISEAEPVLKLTDGGWNWMFHNYYNEQGVTDVYFPLAPMTFPSGFTVILQGNGEELSKTTNKSVTVQRGKILSYDWDTDGLSDLDIQRQALIDFYNAMDGDNWVDNTGWCTDAPINDWYGVSANSSGAVYALMLGLNKLNGRIPESFSKLSALESVQLVENYSGLIENLEAVFSCNRLRDIYIGNCFNISRSEGLVSIPAIIGELSDLSNLTIYGACGELPPELFTLGNLQHLELVKSKLEGTIPANWSGATKLETLRISGDDMSLGGQLPPGMFSCKTLSEIAISGTQMNGVIPEEIGNLSNLRYLELLSNQFTGNLPVAFTTMDNLEWVRLSGPFSGKVPTEFAEWPLWRKQWLFMTQYTDLDISDAMPYVPDFQITDLKGDTYTQNLINQNSLTVCYQFGTTCAHTPGFTKVLKGLYSSYHSDGLEVISWANAEQAEVANYVSSNEMPWIVFASDYQNYIGDQLYPCWDTPVATLYDSNGRLVYYCIGNEDGFEPFVHEWFGGSGAELYESTDFSADGTAHVLQTATEGNGIDIVLMGDAYSDRLIADGTYATVMKRAMEAFFAEEPYKTYRNRFNVRYVDVVSKNEVHTGETALSTWYGEGTAVGGDNPKVVGYAEAALTAAGRSVDDALILVMMNRDYYAGTCYMTGIGDGDYGRGHAIAYMPVSSVGDVFGQVLRHEAGGHGFAKLADEYSYTGAISQDEIDNHRSMEPYGWWRNVDFTADPTAVKWAQFITDNRYASENIGVYEGACTYAFGAFRPTQNSIMNDNTGGFNAPSRYAIWYRINKLSNGSEWTGTYEDFVAWDLAHPSAQSPARRSGRRSPERPLPPLAPPVVTFNLR